MSRSRLPAVALIGLVLAACAPASTPAPSGSTSGSTTTTPALADEQKITYAVGIFPQTMDPHLNVTGTARKYELFETLTRFAPNGPTIEPLLASEFKTVDDTTWRFTIRPGSKFQDNSPVTANDVAFSWARVNRPELKSPIPGFITTVASVTAIDNAVVEIKTKAPDPLLPRRVLNLAIVPKAYIDRVGDADFVAKPIGSGPFSFVSYKPDDSLELAGWKEHPFRKPTLTSLIVRNVPEGSARVAGIRTGAIDIVASPPLDSVDQLKNDGLTIYVTTTGTFGIYLDTYGTDGTDAGPIVNKSVRQALNYAIDRDTIAKQLWRGLAKPAGMLVNEGTEGYSADVKPYTYDVAKAKQLIASAGYPNGFNVTIEVYPILAEYRTTVLAVQDAMRALNVNVEVVVLDLALFVDHYYKRKPTTNLLATGNQNVPLLDADIQLSNFSINGPMGKRYDNPAFEAKLIESRQQVDPAKRLAALREAELLLQEDPPFLFINTLPIVQIASKTVAMPFPPTADGIYFETVSRTR